MSSDLDGLENQEKMSVEDLVSFAMQQADLFSQDRDLETPPIKEDRAKIGFGYNSGKSLFRPYLVGLFEQNLAPIIQK